MLCFACLFLLVWQQAFCQKGEQDITLSYGFFSTPIIASSLGKVVASFITGSDTQLKAVGPLTVGYTYHLGDRVTVGITGSYTQATLHVNDSGEIFSRNKYYTFMPQSTLFLGRKDKVEAYVGLAFGATYYIHSSDSYQEQSPQLSYQVTPIGVRTAGRTGAFLELGYGYKGIVNVGLSRRL